MPEQEKHKHQYKIIKKAELSSTELIFIRCKCGKELMNAKSNLRSSLTNKAFARYYMGGWHDSTFKNYN